MESSKEDGREILLSSVKVRDVALVIALIALFVVVVFKAWRAIKTQVS